MDPFPWWNDKQVKLSEEAKIFADENLAKGQEVLWTKKFPLDLLREVAARGWFGAVIPKEYNGMEMGATGAALITEELSRVGSALGEAYAVSLFGGVEQLLAFGTDEQKRKWLPRIAKGELIGAVCITEPFVGSDAAGVESTAKRQHDDYVINGKKRFITNAGLADVYVVYARTSERPEDRAKYQHLTAFLIEKGAPGFSVEKINELSGWSGLPNGILDFADVKVRQENLIGSEGLGWKVMMAGLNFERIVYSAGMLGPIRESIRNAVSYTQRRIQFGKPTVDIPTNQAKIADMLAGLYTSRLLVYHAARLLDDHKDAMVEAATAKLYTSEAYEKLISDAIMVMGGDGWTRFYPVEGYLRDAKVNQIGAGTNDVMRLVIFRGGLKTLSKDLRLLPRQIHPKLNVPTASSQILEKKEPNEEGLMRILAEDYRVNPGLYMTKDDLKERLIDADDAKIDEIIQRLESKGLAKVYRDGRGTICLVKATYEGLSKFGSREHYRWFPDWLDENLIF